VSHVRALGITAVASCRPGAASRWLQVGAVAGCGCEPRNAPCSSWSWL